ncbi:MAG: aminoglycoside phosphotransferase [Verrucomicrobiaceae bacterium]|nr:aminoglycoside phosphotransferase [Verrucomicrobiaceae bacterium]
MSTVLNENNDEKKLHAFVEKVTGGRVIKLERQIRWRPAWFADVEVNGKVVPIYIRGDRNADILPYPELRREANILQVLEKHGIKVPHVFGFCEDPIAIVMDAVPGSRDVATAPNDEARRSLGRQYVEAMIETQKIPVEEFAKVGLEVPEGAEAVALEGLTETIPLYQRNKSKPQPLIEFALNWVRRNVPKDRTRRVFSHYDAAQFMHKDGKLTALFDFEASLIGDPVCDLVAMRIRDPYEPVGDDVRALWKHYEDVTGAPIDYDALRFHSVLFSTVQSMMVAATVANPQPGSPHDVYMEWELALSRAIVITLSDALDVKIETPKPLVENSGPCTILLHMLADSVSRIDARDEEQAAQKQSIQNLVDTIVRSDKMAADLEQLTLDDLAPILGKRYSSWTEAEIPLEKFVQQSGPEHDLPLIRFFAAWIERRVQLYGPEGIGKSAAHLDYVPTRN